ncbi:sterol desaturase family protein [Planktotalea sp.]|uniref:sterol desaturase family protein n=1 Tax=Planktotalea sp. TaxID=2029877 RepID=UPI003296F9BF
MIQSTQIHQTDMPRIILRWTIYPLSWSIIAFFFWRMTEGVIEPQAAWGATTAILFVTYLFLETVFPYQDRWKMTWRSFWSDFKHMVVNGASIAIVNAGLAYASIALSADLNGPAARLPIWLQIILALVIFEACHYTVHRSMHEGRTRLNKWLWTVHAPHHLPDKLYVLMHVVGHPINQILLQIVVLVLPIWLMGYSQHAIAGYVMITGMHGLISHFNVDVRMGWMNYIFVGTELHRYHHSSDLRDAKNFGATLSIFDQMFGTFVYKPGVAPADLGAANTSLYPYYGDIVKVLKMPFRK